MKYKVVKEYNNAPDSPISIEVGEVLNFIEESNPKGDWPNWLFCRSESKEGWIPKQILEVGGNKVKVLKDYNAKEHNLKLDEVLVADYELNGWIWCYKEHHKGHYGWAPRNHLLKINS